MKHLQRSWIILAEKSNWGFAQLKKKLKDSAGLIQEPEELENKSLTT